MYGVIKYDPCMKMRTIKVRAFDSYQSFWHKGREIFYRRVTDDGKVWSWNKISKNSTNVL